MRGWSGAAGEQQAGQVTVDAATYVAWKWQWLTVSVAEK
jgi:hypothetical protein